MIRFWVREVLGCFLVVVGLFIFYICLGLLLPPAAYILEASILSVIGIIVFRGGIHLLKVAVAARVAMQTQIEPSKPAPAAPAKKPAVAPLDW